LDTKPYEDKFELAMMHFEDELKKIRTGRAHPGQLEGVQVEVYGAKMPLNQAANITAPEAQMLLVTPFDPSNIEVISTAIRGDQTSGLNPGDDGRVIRVPIPALTEDRRKMIVKQAGEKVEETKIAFRNIRQDGLKEAKRLKEAKDLSEDDYKRVENGIDDDVSTYNAKVDGLFASKEKDILTV